MSNIKELPIEISRHIFEFLPKYQCRYCSSYLPPINNRFCDNVCFTIYSRNFWGPCYACVADMRYFFGLFVVGVLVYSGLIGVSTSMYPTYPTIEL